MPIIDVQALIDERVQSIRRFHQQLGASRAELDLSGGIDSAVMAGLLVLALGPERLTLVYSSIHSGDETRKRATDLAASLGVPLVVHDLTATYEAMVGAMVDNLVASGWHRDQLEATIAADNTVLGSIRSCLRAPLGRGYLRLTGNGIRHGTGNECEDRWLRFYQKGGDGEVDTNPIAMLSKGEVYQLAIGLGKRLGSEDAYQAIVCAAPTPELWGAAVPHTDEEEIGAYLGLDAGEHSFYSYVEPQTSAYRTVGLIERLSRFADTKAAKGLFSDKSSEERVAEITIAAQSAPEFDSVSPSLVDALVKAARRAERASRHKYNPTCPSIGDRQALVGQRLLTNELPMV